MTRETAFEIIDVRASVEEENEKYAQQVRTFCRERGIYLINLMASPGAGKTTLLCRLLDVLREDLPAGYDDTGDLIGIIEADVDADVDARTVTGHGARAVQLHTGGSCHMDASMTLRGLEALCGKNASTSANKGEHAGSVAGAKLGRCPRIVILENIGNLVCPAEFDVGADLKLMILSVPEGDDKPLKYPLMFQVSDCLIVNKIDTAPIFDFDLERCMRNAESVRESLGTGPLTHESRDLSPMTHAMPVFPLSAKTGEGFDAFILWLKEKVAL